MPVSVVTFTDQFMLFLPKLVASLVIFAAFWFGARLARDVIRRVGSRSALDVEVRELMENIAAATLIIFGAITALGTLGIDISALVAGLGLTGFALGFALQDIVANTLAGVLILTYRPFRRGDTIKVAGNEGLVLGINLRYTTLQAEGKRILIPNQNLFKEAIVVNERGGQPQETTITGGQPTT